MSSDNDRPLREWLQVFAQSPQIREKLYKTRIENLWSDIMGPMIKGYTKNIRVDQQILYINVMSGPLKSELNIMRETIRQRVNEKMGEEYIKEVRIV